MKEDIFGAELVYLSQMFRLASVRPGGRIEVVDVNQVGGVLLSIFLLFLGLACFRQEVPDPAETLMIFGQAVSVGPSGINNPVSRYVLRGDRPRRCPLTSIS